MNSKRKLKYLTVLCAFLAMVLLPIKVYAACRNVSCGCRGNGIMSCAGATCWYTDSDGCSGHSWYLYDEYGATCTSGGSVEYHCSICPGRRITSSPPLGHDWGSWYCVNSSVHKRSCRRGIATAVLDELIRIAKEANKKAVRLDAIGTNKPAQKLYEKYGFINCGKAMEYYESTGKTEFVYYEYVV